MKAHYLIDELAANPQSDLLAEIDGQQVKITGFRVETWKDSGPIIILEIGEQQCPKQKQQPGSQPASSRFTS